MKRYPKKSKPLRGRRRKKRVEFAPLVISYTSGTTCGALPMYIGSQFTVHIRSCISADIHGVVTEVSV